MASTAPATKKSNKGRKSAAIALALVGVAGLSLASASVLTINTGTLQAGTKDIAGCQGNVAVKVAFTNAFDATIPGFKVSSVDLSGIAAQCTTDFAKVKVILTDGATTPVVLATSVDIAINGTTASFTPASTVKAADIQSVSVVIFN